MDLMMEQNYVLLVAVVVGKALAVARRWQPCHQKSGNEKALLLVLMLE